MWCGGGNNGMRTMHKVTIQSGDDGTRTHGLLRDRQTL